jgi:hypothetical protein
MIEQFLSSVIAGLGLASLALAQGHFAIGKAEIVPPAEWQLTSSVEDRLVFQTADRHQQATISVVHLAADATLEDFTRVCAHWLAAERREMVDGFIEPENPAPFKQGAVFGMFYSGGEKKTGRIFSGYLSMVRGEFVIVYVEGTGVPPEEHLQSFKAFVTGLKRK